MIDRGIQIEDVNRKKKEAQAIRTSQDSRKRKDQGRGELEPDG